MNFGFKEIYKGVLLRPKQTFDLLINDNRKIRFGFAAVCIQALLYTFVYIFLIYGGGEPFKPWLDIPLKDYYNYNVFFCAPSMFLGWILASGVAHLISLAFNGTGTFEQTLSVFGFGISIASWSTGIHDVLSSFLGAIHLIDQHTYEIQLNSPTIWRTLLWIQMTAYLIWFIVLFTKGIRSAHSLSPGKAFATGIVGFLIYQSFFLIFNR